MHIFKKLAVSLIIFIPILSHANVQSKTLAILDPKLCHISPNYVVIEKPHDKAVGTDFLIKYKSKPDETIPCQYQVESGDFEIKNDDANYFLAQQNDLLILDNGTGPDGRELIIWDLNKKVKVFASQYSESYQIKPDSISFWLETGKANNSNCPDLKKWSTDGLGAAIETYVTLNLSNLNLIKSSQTRCQQRQ